MFSKMVKFSLLILMVFTVEGCHKRTILIQQNRDRGVERPVVRNTSQRAVIQEEVLLGRNGSNASLGSRVDVPTNNPTLGTTIGAGDENLSDINSSDSTESTEIHTEVMERMPFPIDEYRSLPKRGRSTVSGVIYLENSHSSEKIVGSKLKMWLNPVTSYSRQWYEESYLGGYKLSKTDKRLYNYIKFDYSDSNGKFNFYGIASGSYYIVGTMRCAEECGFSEPKSIRLVKEIYVGSGVTTVELMKNVP